ncbi:hypothetical protein PoMZ_08948 [Pyricularia oryzae]|uniref:Pwl1 protein n=1 Tax=Pyricularia oryzae TaxID=318829 RepID=B9A9V1_PYROR|nr:hypothetical protein PoMZ_08948 [Pyricularia oryzae]QMU24231.1 PWL1 protein [Pyricularia oryzae]BAH22184.1 Pwl1 protein [Pyricularia oryzae]
MKFNKTIPLYILAFFSTAVIAGGRKWTNKVIYNDKGEREGSISIRKGAEGDFNCGPGYPGGPDRMVRVHEDNGNIRGMPPGYRLGPDDKEDKRDNQYYSRNGYHVGDGPAEYQNHGGGQWGDGYYGPPGEITNQHGKRQGDQGCHIM